jgi:dipeptidyl aminopeptidase/acylaminoacyl peptidase
MDDYLAAIDDGKGKYVDATRLGCVGASYGGILLFI